MAISRPCIGKPCSTLIAGASSGKIRILFSVFALVYALIAGLRTVGDMDLGWQLATGRWIMEHHQIPFTDVLSYTARGQEWIYPLLSQIFFYLSCVIGGFSLLSWIGTAACVGTVALLLRGSSNVQAALTVVAVPLVAARTPPRAEMFSEILFAAFVSLLWLHHRDEHGPLWLLPVLMLFWVNLHLGFIAGLAMCGAYIALELNETLFQSRRAQALIRLKHAAPWLAVTALATFVNPWGPRLYLAFTRQQAILALHSGWIEEWTRVRLTPAAFSEALAWRAPTSVLLWMILVAVCGVAAAVYTRRLVAAIILVIAIWLVVQAVRLQGPFATLVVIIGGSVLAEAFRTEQVRSIINRCTPLPRYRAIATTILILAVVFFALVRCTDLVTNRYYLRFPGQFSTFGAGEATWYPKEAAAFMLRNHLPGNIFNDFNSGGFLTWALPVYPDYIDGRSVPFGSALFVHSEQLLNQALDSPFWENEADSRNIKTVFVSVDHEMGIALKVLDKFCSSRGWRPVYLDETGAIFVRVTPATSELVQRLQIDCKAISFERLPTTSISNAQEFRHLVNAGFIFVVLDRNSDALRILDQAEQIFSDDPSLHYAKGIALNNLDRPVDGERQLLTATRLGSNDAALALARIYEAAARYTDEMSLLDPIAERASQPYLLYLRLAYAQIYAGYPDKSEISFERAEATSPFQGAAYPLGEDFRSQIARGRQLASGSR